MYYQFVQPSSHGFYQNVCACTRYLLHRFIRVINTHTRVFFGPLSWSTPVSRYAKKHPSTRTPPTHQPPYLPPSTPNPSSLLTRHTWQSLCTTSSHVLFGPPLGLQHTTSYSIHFFTQSLSSFRNTCPYRHSLFCCSSNVMSTIPSLSLNSLFETLSFNFTPHIHLTSLITAISFSFLTGQVSLPCNILLRTQLLYSFPLLINLW